LPYGKTKSKTIYENVYLATEDSLTGHDDSVRRPVVA